MRLQGTGRDRSHTLCITLHSQGRALTAQLNNSYWWGAEQDVWSLVQIFGAWRNFLQGWCIEWLVTWHWRCMIVTEQTCLWHDNAVNGSDKDVCIWQVCFITYTSSPNIFIFPVSASANQWARSKWMWMKAAASRARGNHRQTILLLATVRCCFNKGYKTAPCLHHL